MHRDAKRGRISDLVFKDQAIAQRIFESLVARLDEVVQINEITECTVTARVDGRNSAPDRVLRDALSE